MRYFNLMTVLVALSVYSVKADDYRSRSYALLNLAIEQCRELRRVIPVELSDTANIVANIPIYCMRLPAEELALESYSDLLPLIDFTDDDMSQIAIIKKDNTYLAMESKIGINKRWQATLHSESPRILPSPTITFADNKFGYKGKRYSVKGILDWMEKNPGQRLFSILGMKGLYYVKDNCLFRINFGRKGVVKVEDGQKYYEKHVLRNGVYCISNIIVGGWCPSYDK